MGKGAKAAVRTLRWVGASAVVVIGLALAVPFMIPTWSYIPELNRLLTQQLGMTVAIQDLKLYVLPTPRITAYGVRLGKSQETRIGALEIVPDLGSLLSVPTSIRLVRVANLELEEGELARMFTTSVAEAGRPLPFDVRRIVLNQVRLRQPDFERPSFDIDAQLGRGMRLSAVRLQAEGTDVRLQVVPEGRSGATVKVGGTLYGGEIAAVSQATWADEWHVVGKAAISDVDIVLLQEMLGMSGRLSGRLKGEVTFGARALTAEHLADVLEIDGGFELVRGAYHGVDLAKATEPDSEAADDDATEFNEFRGKLRVRGAHVRINDLCLRSPKLVAGGNIEITPPEQKLSGKLGLAVPGTAGLLGVPVSLSGTVEEPSVVPSKAYLIGAAVGTVILPGIGTGIGASAGSFFASVSTCK
jgi:uncharacterized protein involved in outer membrane biogenesis